MEMRRATKDDLPAIVGLLADDVRGRARDDASLPLDPAYLAAFEAIDADPMQYLAVAVLDGRIVGTQQLTLIPGIGHKGAWRGQIEAVRIASDLRGQGLGAEMIGWAVETCRERGCRMVQLTSDASRLDTHRFYERLGFQKSHFGFKLTL
ncbi:GNAT family N-acetyltransferase [Jiella endophytica]|nr:GNAT family N-acetyltransferase [Jiella endophytica]